MKRTSDQSVPWLKLERILGIVNQRESSTLSSSKGRSESKDDNQILLNLVHSTQFSPELISGDVGSGRVENINDHLLSLQESVGEELSSSDRDCAVGVLSFQT